MPTFEFTSPEGKTYEIDGPEGATPEQAFAILNQHLSNTDKANTSTVGDIAKSGGIGVVKGGIGLAGMPGDIGSAISSGVSAAGDAIGLPPSAVQTAKGAFSTAARFAPGLSAFVSGPTSGDLQGAVEGVTGKLYDPKTTAGKYAQSVGEFVPAMIGGPESLGLKFLTRAAVPGIASEAAGQLTGDNPYAKAAAGLIAGAGAGMAANRLTAPKPPAVPSAEDLLSTARGQFRQAEGLNVKAKADAIDAIASDMRSALKSFDPDAQKPVFNAISRLEQMASPPQIGPQAPVSMNEVDLVRKRLVNAKTSPDPATREAARKAIEVLNQAKSNLTPADVIKGDAAAYAKLNSDAVANWAAGKRSNIVMGKAALGDLNAQTAGTGSNGDNALRQAIKQLARPVNNDITPKWQRLGFNQQEGDAINAVARGSLLGNTARYLGKAAPTGSVSAVLSMGAGHAAGGPLGAVVLPAAGYLAKKIGDLSTRQGIKALDSLVRSRSPLAAQVAAAHPALTSQLPQSSQLILRSMVAATPQLAMSGQLVQ